MFQIIEKGGPIMWPLMITSVISLAVVLERLLFTMRVKMRRQPKVVETLFAKVEQGDIEGAIKNRDKSLSSALLKAANQELKRFNQGLFVLDTVITLAPLLGLLATVTGMIHAFGLIGHRELDTPTVITGGIAEALIGTAFGLAIAILALIPFNYLNAFMEQARREIEDASTHLELLLIEPQDAP